MTCLIDNVYRFSVQRVRTLDLIKKFDFKKLKIYKLGLPNEETGSLYF